MAERSKRAGSAGEEQAAEAGPSRPSGERENYGWLASSAVPAKKRRIIEGVGDTGVVELQAQLYRTQQHVTQWKEGGLDPADKHVRRRAGLDVSQLMQRSNAGVAERASADRLALKATGEGAERAAAAAAALERKAELYERLARGEAAAGDDAYEVDFVSKGLLSDEAAREGDWLEERDEARRRRDAAAAAGAAPDTAGAALGGGGGMVSADMLRERERRAWEEEEESRRAAEAAAADARAARIEAVLGLTAETEAGRARAEEQKAARDAALASKRQKLKAAFLQQQIAKAAAAAAAGKGKAGGGAAKGGGARPGAGA